jgi:hypothetical protein
MTKWEYKVVHREDEFNGIRIEYLRTQEQEQWLNELGYEGWELIISAADRTDYYYFKRPLQ